MLLSWTEGQEVRTVWCSKTGSLWRKFRDKEGERGRSDGGWWRDWKRKGREGRRWESGCDLYEFKKCCYLIKSRCNKDCTFSPMSTCKWFQICCFCIPGASLPPHTIICEYLWAKPSHEAWKGSPGKINLIEERKFCGKNAKAISVCQLNWWISKTDLGKYDKIGLKTKTDLHNTWGKRGIFHCFK